MAMIINSYQRYFILGFVFLCSCKGKGDLDNVLKTNEKKLAEYQTEIIQKEDDSSESQSQKINLKDISENSTKNFTRIIPPWVQVKLIKEKIVLSENERKSFCQLDFNNDKQVDVIFIRNEGLLVFQKKKKTKVLNKIYNEQGQVLNEFNWIDYFYIDDNKEIINYNKNLKVAGQVLKLIKESSGLVSVYHDGKDFKWISFD